jgi:hypothetical protein
MQNNNKKNKNNNTGKCNTTTQTIQTLPMMQYNNQTDIDSCILSLETQNIPLSGINAFTKNLKILVKHANNISQSEDKSSSEKLHSLLNCYRFMNYYLSNYNDEIARTSSTARYKLFEVSYRKAIKNRNDIMKNDDNIFTRVEYEEANKVFTEYMNIWMLNEYKWFPLAWRKENDI